MMMKMRIDENKAKYNSMKFLPKQFSEDLVRIKRFEVSALMVFRIVISR